jgi:glycosyltransferase involved in cell wall biosynthesis
MMTEMSDNSPLDIALLAPLVSPIREPFLGGSQAVARDLAVALAARGHRVTLYAAQGSDTAALPGVTLTPIAVDAERVRPTNFAARRADQPPAAPDAAVEQAFQRVFDAIAARTPHHQLVHAHAYDEPAFRLAQRLPMPVAHTLHLDAIVPEINATLTRLAPAHRDRAARQPWLATVSRSCAASYADICHIDAVIYNGLDLDAIPFAAAPAPDAHALFAGRIAPEKGVEDAIQIALAADMPLTLVGAVYDQAYYAARIQPLIDVRPDRLRWLGPLPREEVWRRMSAATVTLIPSLWNEPFGLVACEALATGTPVVGYESGALPEIVEQGTTGMLVPRGAIAEAAAAIPAAARLDRAACRQRIAAHFSLTAFVTAHERLFRQMLANG